MSWIVLTYHEWTLIHSRQVVSTLGSARWIISANRMNEIVTHSSVSSLFISLWCLEYCCGPDWIVLGLRARHRCQQGLVPVQVPDGALLVSLVIPSARARLGRHGHKWSFRLLVGLVLVFVAQLFGLIVLLLMRSLALCNLWCSTSVRQRPAT